MKKEDNTQKKEYKNWLETLKTIVFSIFIALILNSLVGPTLVSGTSMYPTLKDSDYLFINKLSYSSLFGGENKIPGRGNIIVFDTKADVRNILIKRVVAVQGDHLVIKDSHVYVNEELLEENYIYEDIYTGEVDIVIPDGQVFVMGDNRNNSLDSRYIGCIDTKDIIGNVMFRLLPLSSITKF